MRRARVLRHVLQALQHAEIHGRLRVLPVAGDPFRLHGNGERRPAGLSLQGDGQALVGEERRVDPPGELPKILQGLLRLLLYLGQHLVRLRLVPPDQGVGQSRLDGQCYELLLCAVVDVAFELPSFLVLGCHQPLP